MKFTGSFPTYAYRLKFWGLLLSIDPLYGSGLVHRPAWLSCFRNQEWSRPVALSLSVSAYFSVGPPAVPKPCPMVLKPTFEFISSPNAVKSVLDCANPELLMTPLDEPCQSLRTYFAPPSSVD